MKRGDGCKDCKLSWPLPIMLNDDLWASICDDKEDVICFVCMEKRMGRYIRVGDLKSGLPLSEEWAGILADRVP